MNTISSFAPLLNESTEILILGSMPGVASLKASQYYAHPRNAFWPLLADLLEFDLRAGYDERVLALRERGVGLWDVLASCERPGSLDQAINAASIQLNPLADLLNDCPKLRCPKLMRVLTNGASASRLFERHCLPAMRTRRPNLDWHALPSTSPANAGWSWARKRAAWAQALQRL